MGTILLPQGQLVMSGDMLFGCPNWEGGCYWQLVVEATVSVKHPTLPRTTPRKKDYPVPNDSSVNVGKARCAFLNLVQTTL